MATSKTLIKRKAKQFALEANEILARKVRVGQFQIDPESNIECIPLIVEMSFVYHGFIERFEQRVGVNFFGIKVKGKKIHILFSRGECLYL